MLRIFTVALSLSLVIPLFSQGTLTDSNKAKAHRKGKAEAKLYAKRGMENTDTSQSLETALVSFYELVYTGESSSNRTYVWGAGEGKSSDANEAYKKGLADAKNHIPGLMATYFNMWIMSSDLSEKDKTLVHTAIGDATPAFSIKILEREPFKILHLKSEKKGKHRSHVRVLYNQEKIRELCRYEIKVYLNDETGWSDEKMTKVLTFDH